MPSKALGVKLDDLARLLDALTPEERAAIGTDESMRARIAHACQRLHVLHAGQPEPEAEPAARGPVAVVERNTFGHPRRTIPAESSAAAVHWEQDSWRSR